MTRDDILALARQAGSADGTTPLEKSIVLYAAKSSKFLEKFAALIANNEREACAKVCLEGTDMPVQKDTLKIIKAERKRIAAAIRARSEK